MADHDKSLEPGPAKRRCRNQLFCGHCKKFLPKSTFYRHKSDYYNNVSKTWQQLDTSSSSSTCMVPVTNISETETSSESGGEDDDSNDIFALQNENQFHGMYRD